MLPQYFNQYELVKIPAIHGPLDASGIPMFDPRLSGINESICYHPTVIIQYGLAKYNRWVQTSLDSDYDDFSLCCEWLIKNVASSPNAKFSAWYIPFDHIKLKIKAPWISALTQAQGLSLLLRYYEQNTDKKLKAILQKIAHAFLFSLEEGGVTSKIGEFFFLQEAGSIRILNGCLSALIGLYEYLELFEDKEITEVFDGTVSYLEKHLDDYDLEFWSLYSTGVRYNITDKHYHSTHVRQLNYLGNILKNEIFLKCATKWDSYQVDKIALIKYKMYRATFFNIQRFLTLFKLDRLKFKH